MPKEVRIINTRPGEPGRELTYDLKSLGYDVFSLPLIRIDSLSCQREVICFLQMMQRNDILVFTSANGVRSLASSLGVLQGSLWSMLGHLRVAVVGEGTAQAAKNCGLKIWLVAQEQTAEGLGRQLATRIAGELHPESYPRVFIFRAKNSDPRLSAPLLDSGLEVKDIAVYEVTPLSIEELPMRELTQWLSRREIATVIVLSSSRAARAWHQCETAVLRDRCNYPVDTKNFFYLPCGKRVAQAVHDLNFSNILSTCAPGNHSIKDFLEKTTKADLSL